MFLQPSLKEENTMGSRGEASSVQGGMAALASSPPPEPFPQPFSSPRRAEQPHSKERCVSVCVCVSSPKTVHIQSAVLTRKELTSVEGLKQHWSDQFSWPSELRGGGSGRLLCSELGRETSRRVWETGRILYALLERELSLYL